MAEFNERNGFLKEEILLYQYLKGKVLGTSGKENKFEKNKNGAEEMNKFKKDGAKRSKKKKGGFGLLGLITQAILIGILGCFLLYFAGFSLIDNYNKTQETKNAHFLGNDVFQVKILYDEEFLTYFNAGYLARQKNLTAEQTIEKILERVSQSWERQTGIKFVLENVEQFKSENQSAERLLYYLAQKQPLVGADIIIAFSGKPQVGKFWVNTASDIKGDYLVICYPWFESWKINPFFGDPYFIERSAYLLNRELGKVFGFIETKQIASAIPTFGTQEEYLRYQSEILTQPIKESLKNTFPLFTRLDLSNEKIAELKIQASTIGYNVGYETAFDEEYWGRKLVTNYTFQNEKRYFDVGVFKESCQKSYRDGSEIGRAEGQRVKSQEELGQLLLKDPTYQEMKNFLEQNQTNKRAYRWEIYMCHQYSQDTVNHAKSYGIRAGYALLYFPDSRSRMWGHAIICFNTTDKGLIFVEPQLDKEVKVEVGKSYWDQNGLSGVSGVGYDDRITRIEITWSDGTTQVIAKK